MLLDAREGLCERRLGQSSVTDNACLLPNLQGLAVPQQRDTHMVESMISATPQS